MLFVFLNTQEYSISNAGYNWQICIASPHTECTLVDKSFTNCIAISFLLSHIKSSGILDKMHISGYVKY